MLSRPLGSYSDPAILGHMQQVKTASTMLHRGYQGSWEIRDGGLLLVDLKATIRDWDLTDGWHLVERDLDWMFPGSRGPVFADWFSGDLECAQGLPEQVNDSYVMWPTLKILQVRRGEVTGSHVKLLAEIMSSTHSICRVGFILRTSRQTSSSPQGFGLVD